MDKNSKIEKSYDELTYKSAAFAQSSPYKLEACATLLGINPPPCKNAKFGEQDAVWWKFDPICRK